MKIPNHPRFPILLAGLVSASLLSWGCGGGPDSASRAAKGDPAPAAGEVGGAVRCAAHGAPADRCFLCDPALRDPGRLWCGEHARYEDRCWICHPELKDASRLYCEEHGLYEDECFLCHPDLPGTGADTSASSSPEDSRAGDGLFCKEHRVDESECGICHPDLADRLEPGQGLLIRMPSGASAAKAGVVAQAVSGTEAPGFIEAPGRLDFDRNRHARLAAPLDGIVRRVNVDLGESVAPGTVLVEMSSPEWASARAAFLTAAAEEDAAHAAYRREEELHAGRVSSRRDLEDARARFESARASRRAAEETLLGLGLAPGDLAAIREGDAAVHLPIRAPFAGTVVSREATVGEMASLGVPLITVSALDPLWAILTVPSEAAAGIEPGMFVDLLVDGAVIARGHVTWVAQALEVSTRMVEIRAEVPNPDRRLRPGTFVSARIHHAGESRAIRIPRDVVHRFGGQPFVFLERNQDLYEARRVAMGAESGGAALVLAGLADGDRVVMARSFLLKSEFQKSRLGAGCVD